MAFSITKDYGCIIYTNCNRKHEKFNKKDLCTQGELKLIETVCLLNIFADWSRCDTINPREIKLCNNVFFFVFFK